MGSATVGGAALLGDFDYDGLREAVRGLSPIVYYWSLVITTSGICLNFLVGILGGALTDVAGGDSAGDRDGILSYAARSARRLRWEFRHVRGLRGYRPLATNVLSPPPHVYWPWRAIDSLHETVELAWTAERLRAEGDAFGDWAVAALESLADDGVIVELL